MRKLRKIISAILVVVLCVQIIAPGTIAIGTTPLIGDNAAMSASEGETMSAQGGSSALSELETAVTTNELTTASSEDSSITPIVGEVDVLRTENTKHYRHEDGTYTAAVYPEPVHYMDSTGSWQDIDNTLTLNNKKRSVAGQATYTPAASALDVQIPQDFSNGQMLTIGKDGYTVGMRIKTSDNSETMSMSTTAIATEVSSVKAEIDNNFRSLETSKVSVISDTDDSNDATVKKANEEKMKLDNKVSAVNYSDIFNGADLQYVITPSKVKENIIVNEPQDTYIYQFELELGGLIPVAQDNGSIKLYENKDDNEALFTIETPYMYDANEETSFDVTMSLNGNILTVTANAEWINDENRKFPVIIDPTFSTNASTFYDATANKNTPSMNFESYKYLYAGNGLLSMRRTYLKFTLPKLPNGSVVTNAELKLIQYDVDLGDEDSYLYAFDLTEHGTWSESSITWNNQPISTTANAAHDDNDIKNLDFELFKIDDDKGQVYFFNLTKAVKNWYEKFTNNGIMITSSDETSNSQTTLYSSDHSSSSYHPAVTIEYNSNIGLEDYWSYETVDLGRSGAVYANPYNGSVTYTHSDLSMTGNLLPISIAHIHNNNADDIYSSVYSGMYVGYKYHLNIQEVIIPISSSDSLYDSGYRYKHYDSDGTLHYYISNGSQFTHQYDPTLVLTVSDSEYIITDAQGNKKHFNSAGQLYKIADNNGNTQIYAFSGNQIISVTDPVGRVAVLTYNSYDQLESITDPAGRITTYTYSGTTSTATLTKITYSDGNTTSFTYSSTNISQITAYDGSYCALDYNYLYYRGYRVETIEQGDKSSQVVDISTFKYVQSNPSGIASGNTVVTNTLDDSNTYLFDIYGRTTSITNEKYQTQYAVYNDYSSSSSAKFNKLKDSSELLTISTNLLKNHGFEYDEYWTIAQSAETGECNYTSEESSNGERSAKLELTEDSGIYEVDQDFDAVAGNTYTVSIDIYIPEELDVTGNNGALFGFVYCIDGEWKTESSRWITSTSGWERFSHTITLPEGTLENCHVFIELARAKGTVYFDNVQVEKSGGARSYNLIENSDFSKGTGTDVYAWSKSGTQSLDGVQFDDNSDRNFFMMTGSTEHNKEISQKVYVNAQAGDSLIIGGKVAAYATSGTNDNSIFGIYADLYNDSGEFVETVAVEFDRNVSQERQVRAAYVPLKENCKYLYFYFRYYKQTDALTIDDAFVYVDSYGEHYTYDETSGLTTTVYNDEGKVTCYSYDNNDISEITQFTSIERAEEIKEDSNIEPEIGELVATYSYDDSHNVTTATNNIGTTIEYTYNETGQITEQTTITTDENGEEVSISESFTYYQNGNYIKEYVDETGSVTTYIYDNDDTGENIAKGLVTSVQDSAGNITTYTYEPNTDELLSVSGNSNPYVSTTTSFTYEDYLPKTITRNGTTYSYDYDDQNRVVASKVGSQTLVTNSYNDKQKLSEVSYENGAEYVPVYGERDRLVGDTWNDTQISHYYYNENDRLSKLVDNVTNVSYQYDYAFYDLPFRVTGSDGTLTTYDYNRSGILARLTFSDDNVNIYSGKYYTNEKGMPEDVVIDTLDNAVMHYNYDDFGRIEDYSCGPVIRTYKYAEEQTENGTSANNQIVEIIDENLSGEVLQHYTLEYHDDGSLYSSVENIGEQYYYHYYDGLGRLEESFINDDLYDYFYDTDGNVILVDKNLEALHTYTYGNDNWKDQLTAFDGKAITYDANGNPLTYDGYSYTWQRGTQLAGITGNDENISYVYDSQGNRVQKTVNGVTTSYLYSGDLLMRQTDGTNTLDFQYDANGDMIGFVYNGTPYYYLRNLLNDISGIVDENGEVVAQYMYDSYGNLISSAGDMASINPIRYRGYYYDAETNWYYLESRYYSPEWCRFISPDSLFVAGDVINGSNMYAYCYDNPVMYRDDSGALPTLNEFIDYYIEEPVWFVSKIIANTISSIPGIPEFLDEASNKLLSGVIEQIIKDTGEDKDFMQTTIGNVFAGVLCIGSHLLFAHFPPITDTFNFATGIRHFMPVNMDFGAPWAGYFLSFKNDGNGNYTSDPTVEMWQSRVGYTPTYDFFFSLGGPIFREKYEFQVENSGPLSILFPQTYYVVWIWKGDYWNLGAGAEIGIYRTSLKHHYENGFYEVVTDLTLDVDMTIKYDGNILNNLVQTNWWVCSFTPKYQLIDITKLNVFLKVKFTDPTLREPFYMQYVDNANTYLEWDEIDMLINPPYTDDNVNEYQFTVTY